MKALFTTCSAILIIGVQALGAQLTIEDISPRFPPDVKIVWAASTNHLPKLLPIYRRGEQVFSASVISNAIALASFPIPQKITASSNSLTLRDREGDRWSRAFHILPEFGQIDYQDRSDLRGAAGVPNTDEVSNLAWEYAVRLGIARSELVEKPESRRTEECQHGPAKDQICSRGTFLTRKQGDFEFRDFGFQIDFGSQAQIRRFYLIWPDLKPCETLAVAPSEQIIACIKARKAPLTLTADGSVDWDKLNALTKTSKLTITLITPIYTEGRYGDTSEGADASGDVAPYAELECIADLGVTNVHARLLAPILSVDADKLVK